MRGEAIKPSNEGNAKKELDGLIEKYFIQPSYSPYASPVVMVKKKDGSIRFTCDFRNEVTMCDLFGGRLYLLFKVD